MSISGDYHVTNTLVSCDDHVIIMWHWGPTYLLYIYVPWVSCCPFCILPVPRCLSSPSCAGAREQSFVQKAPARRQKISKSTIHSGKFSRGSIFTNGQSFNYHFTIVYVQLSLFHRFNFWQLDGRPWKPQKLDPLKISHYIMVYTKSILLYTPNKDLLRG